MKLDDQQIARAAVAAAVAGTVLAPIAALSRFATEDGKEDLESGVVRAWAEPAADALAPLLEWASADTVYLTYGKLWAPILLVVVLTAVAVRRTREPAGAEKWGWRLTLTGLVGMTVGVTGSYWTPLLEEFFLATLPFMLIGMVGALVLGIPLLRRGFRPRAAAVLLILWLPLFFVLSSVIAMGAALLPALWAFALAGRTLGASTPTRQVAGVS
ncbi:MAG: hypothetical protein EPN99_03830 [Frankiales bacterium]|nr:MAG: hypothetical protein EPN99_03830 [Frankiales bacterium]